MKHIDNHGWAALVLLLGATLSDAHAQDTSSTAAPSAAPKTPALRSLADQPPPDTKSEPPTPDEWNGAEQVALLGELPEHCTAKLVREWLQIRCAANGGSLSVISGSREGVSASLVPMSFKPGASEPTTGSSTVVMPIRRGDRRVMQLMTMSFAEYSGNVWPHLELLISEQWLDDQTGPWVSVTKEI